MPPLLIINPTSDVDFVHACRSHLGAAAGDPVRLEASLRVRYPETVVRPRELSGETIVVWYVYRDGHWVPSS
jgi:hypothetical protein